MTEGYLKNTKMSHRKKFGQFFTPNLVAKFMTEWLAVNSPKKYLDPAFGLGVFAEEAKISKERESFVAYELDSKIYKYSKNKFSNLIELKNKDYLLDWTGKDYDSIVCNPPYMKFQKFQSKDDILRMFQDKMKIKLSGYTNTAAAFLLKSVYELKEGGQLAYIMPFEFMNAGYGEAVKSYLLSQGDVNAFIKVECEKETFSEVTTSVGIILFTKQEQPIAEIPFYVVTKLSQLLSFSQEKPVKILSRSGLNPEDKWAKYFEENNLVINDNNFCSLSYYGKFSRGIATGANEYFLINATDSKKYKIPKSSLIPCVSKSSQINSAIFEENDLQKLIDLDAKVFLINLEKNTKNLAVETYINKGEVEKINLRYLTKMRTPWYRLEKRNPPELFFGVFSRDGYKVIRNLTETISLTCYHGFTSNKKGSKYLDKLFFYLLSDAGRKIMKMNMRKYGDGLDKFEPGDLNQSLVPTEKWLSALKVDCKAEYASIRKSGAISAKLNRYFNRLLEE